MGSFDLGSQLKDLAQLQRDGNLSKDQYARAKTILLDNRHPQQHTLVDELYALLDLYDTDQLNVKEFEQAKASLLGLSPNFKFKNTPEVSQQMEDDSPYDEEESPAKEKSSLFTYIRDVPDSQANNKNLAAALDRIEEADDYELEELEHKYKMQIYKMGFALLFLAPVSLYLGLYVLASAVNINFTKAYADAIAGLLIMALVAVPAIAAYNKLIQNEYLLRVVREKQGHRFSIRWAYQFSAYLGFSVLLCGFCACSSTVWAGLRARDYVPPTPRATQTQVVTVRQAAAATATQKPVQPTAAVTSTQKNTSSSQMPTVVVATTTPTTSKVASATPVPTNTQAATPTFQPTAVVGQATTNGVNARSCASTTCDVVKVVSSRDSFDITGTYDNWHSVEFEDGKTGYIRSDFVVLPEGAVLPAGPTLTSTPRPTSTKRPTIVPLPTLTEEAFYLSEADMWTIMKSGLQAYDSPITSISRKGNELIIVAPETSSFDETYITEYRAFYLGRLVDGVVAIYEQDFAGQIRPPTYITIRFEYDGLLYSVFEVNYDDAKAFIEGRISADTFVKRVRVTNH